MLNEYMRIQDLSWERKPGKAETGNYVRTGVCSNGELNCLFFFPKFLRRFDHSRLFPSIHTLVTATHEVTHSRRKADFSLAYKQSRSHLLNALKALSVTTIKIPSASVFLHINDDEIMLEKDCLEKWEMKRNVLVCVSLRTDANTSHYQDSVKDVSADNSFW